jgi:L-ascorbate metabolism protein UlaG (beta-lactamase superfamily)
LGLGDGEGAEGLADGVPTTETAGDGGDGVGAVAAVFAGGWRTLEFAGDGGPIGEEGDVVDALVVLVEIKSSRAQEGVP